ncbi:putative pentatricopeptide repeat-containing protein [Camellia lanceoleosa]|uniref:Pentatricopeptide repeat-containing protein n=1 Tax=Camellia lanceoleosa TaxID=1840588 RepID=A0ACC0FSV5_9ERIC|nr:putative pentatricopeptide repeat-containing protein [Camellia lanceoleosa]
MPERNVVSFTAMIDGFAKAGDMASARFLFDQSPVKDIVSCDVSDVVDDVCVMFDVVLMMMFDVVLIIML